MPITFGQADSQNERWERGRLHLLHTHVPGLLLSGVRRGSLLRIDAAVDQLIPPLSVPFALAGLCLIVSVALGATLAATLAGLSLAGQLLYLLCGLVLVGAPLSVYRAFGYAPLYLSWKLGLYVRALVSPKSMRWVRTDRVPTPGTVIRVNGHAGPVTEGSRP
jgi:1,2-diacylglycerol 3-beta-glucosyltransferase